ncbi:DUF3140 domain-containing protein [Phytohabitans sp. ZYX-F-186]|uniref:DUF3140 domain-containing protein n=1 Tax=Phytohabitans maris TaxID=3071409 RepID=A0ABU0ZR36_9ACTN|nr:DUF3140 domain-containing protein [Phytohabitans sp. ZYX-F-186]MDQ7909494.1 DUF3140 domain-containing protein [Phytohabitans sp. ZYX-F-186]
MAGADPELERVWQDFHAAVNMTSPQLRDWLLAETALNDTYPPEPDVDVMDLGNHVLRVLGKRRVDLTGDDVTLMREVTDLINRRLSQRPADDVDLEPWRHSLMAVGHDPWRDLR